MKLTRKDLLAYLIPGKVFYIRSESVPEDFHYFVLVNANPSEILPTLYVMATSQIEKRRKQLRFSHQSIETLVYADHSICGFLTKPSVFDCNMVYESSLELLLEQINDGGKVVGDVDRDFLRKLRHGIKISKTVSRRKINMI